ncbi:hypothetical protein J5N97_014386 [Dioscorea zingiberensis]|uniref:PB1-like domain-containing protein n=1 Tax=Dioscorea zingiberensis TaxID=325984 RepID=A0A9D5CUP2_9LILI|nr:hypothetical protein J5N97_014386 [Dioscorea zingiberensis]
MGNWRNENEMVYEGGLVEKVESVNVDYISYFSLFQYFTDVGCARGGRMWFKIQGLSGNLGIEEILNDADTSNMLYYNSGYGYVDVFMVEHDPPLVSLPSEVPAKEGQQNMGQVRSAENITSYDIPVSCSSDESYQPSGESIDEIISDDSDLGNASWLYEDFEGDDDNIFTNGPGASHGGNSSLNENMEETTEAIENVDL